MVNGGEREGDGGDRDGTRRTQVREEPAAHDRTPCVQPATQEGGRGRHARSGAVGVSVDVATSENDICLEEINQMSRHVATFA